MGSQQFLFDELKKYGFFCMRSECLPTHMKRYLYTKKATGKQDLVFEPLVNVCCERTLSRTTSLFVEGFERYSPAGLYLGYKYDFYKVSYYRGENPSEMKVYGQNLTVKEVLKRLRGFEFLKQ